MSELGPKQLELLAKMCSLTLVLLTPDRVSASLLKRGMVRESEKSGALCISPNGLRTIADAVEAGRVDDALTRMAARKSGGDA